MTSSTTKERRERKELILSIIDNNFQSTLEIFLKAEKLNYKWEQKTILRDLEELEKQNKITKNTKYEGRGYGTRNFWKTKNA